ncbi:S8 family serine peptidase [Frigidibacter sp. SD6-1]|uniref:S8 family serine peptidase n=1 Tax=Frigidibacter sp. SD6-1 TaxID=3032581 RepID=UPI0024E01605|nr:S8 family serine peptidase [Frigidibacter sp. SD6-1]
MILTVARIVALALGLIGFGLSGSAWAHDCLLKCDEPPPPPPPPEPPAIADRDGDRDPMVIAPVAAAVAPSGRSEYMLTGTADAVAAASALLEEMGGKVIARRRLKSLGLGMITADLGRIGSADDLRRRLAREGLAVGVESNMVYKQAAGPLTYAPALAGAPDGDPCPLGKALSIGVIDGPVDAGTTALAGARIASRSFLREGDAAGAPDHATALAALIAAPGNGQWPAGFARKARVLSAVAFAKGTTGDVARADAIAAALDWLATERVQLVNLSLAGPENATLGMVLHELARRGTIFVAATGNDGADAVSFPASHPDVFAISAVDARKRLYYKANRGTEVSFVAPGVELFVPTADGGRYRSGTSYAAAIATAIFAHAIDGGLSGGDAIEKALGAAAEDLGPKGRDRSFGWGLLQLTDCSKKI